MKINEKLNLVIPMEDSAGQTYYLHSTPLSREAFDANYLLLSQAFSLMVEQGIQVTAGPRVANLVLRDLAERQDRMPAYDAVIAEIKRITTVIKPSASGWEPLPLSSALARGVVTEDELSDAVSLIVFYIDLCSLVGKTPGRQPEFHEWALGNGEYLIELYGVHQFLADIDRGREFWRDGGGIVASVFDYMQTEGFKRFFGMWGVKASSAHEYRCRYQKPPQPVIGQY